MRVKVREDSSLTINTRILRVTARVKFHTHVFYVYFACKSAILHVTYTRVNATTPVTCIVILTFNRNCEDYNDQKDIYPREHQFPQGLPCADFLRILVTSESEVQGILKALAHWKTTTHNNWYLVWLTTKTITTRNEQFQYSLIRLPDQPTCFLVGLRPHRARRKRLDRYQTSDVRFLISDVWFQTSDVRRLISDSDVRYQK